MYPSSNILFESRRPLMLATKGSAGVASEMIHSEDRVTNHVVVGEENHPGFETSDMVGIYGFSTTYHCFVLN